MKLEQLLESASKNMIKAAANVTEKLLKIGGERVVRPEEDEDIVLMSKKGKLWKHKATKLDGVPYNDCHRVTANVCQVNKRFSAITGFALSKDGLWRPHSFMFDTVDKSILEPTPIIRVKYWGVLMSGKDAERFIKSNAR